jgi:hypothetical protein
MSGEFVKGRSSIYRKILRYYSTIHLQFYPHFTILPTHTITPTYTPTNITISPTNYYYYNYHLLSHYFITTII